MALDFALGGLLSGVGGLVGGLGAAKSASAQNRAMREMMERAIEEGNIGTVIRYLGARGAGGEDLLRALLPDATERKTIGKRAVAGTPLTQDETSRLNDLRRQRDALPTPTTRYMRNRLVTQDPSAETRRQLDAEIGVLERKAGGTAGEAGLFDFEDFSGLGGGYLGGLEKLRGEASSAGRATLGRYDADTERLNNEALAIESDAARFQQGQAERVDRDADRYFANASNKAIGTMRGAGLGGSSILANQIGEAGRMAAEYAGDRKSDIEDRSLQFRTNLRTGRLGMLGDRLTRRTALDTSLQDRDIGLGTNIAAGEERLTFGGYNPNTNYAAFAPTASPTGTAAQSFGATLGGLGGTMLGYGLQRGLDDGTMAEYNARRRLPYAGRAG